MHVDDRYEPPVTPTHLRGKKGAHRHSWERVEPTKFVEEWRCTTCGDFRITEWPVPFKQFLRAFKKKHWAGIPGWEIKD